MVYVLNTPVLTNTGVFKAADISVDEARVVLADGFQSAVGHQGTADVLSAVLGVHVPFNRQAIVMQPGDKAVVFRLKTRLPEGVVLTAEELQQLEYDLWLLERLE